MSRLGVRLVVFGSGGARQVPEGFSKQEAFQQLVDFGKRIAPEARSRNITIAIEPLRKQETNIVNNTTEALAWVNAVNDPKIQLMIDFYHFSVEKRRPLRDSEGSRSSAASAHGEPERPRHAGEMGGVQLRPIFRDSAPDPLRQVDQPGRHES